MFSLITIIVFLMSLMAITPMFMMLFDFLLIPKENRVTTFLFKTIIPLILIGLMVIYLNQYGKIIFNKENIILFSFYIVSSFLYIRILTEEVIYMNHDIVYNNKFSSSYFFVIASFFLWPLYVSGFLFEKLKTKINQMLLPNSTLSGEKILTEKEKLIIEKENNKVLIVEKEKLLSSIEKKDNQIKNMEEEIRNLYFQNELLKQEKDKLTKLNIKETNHIDNTKNDNINFGY